VKRKYDIVPCHVSLASVHNTDTLRRYWDISRREYVHTVSTTPTATTTKLTLCCVVRAIFSPTLNCPHFTLPVSFATVTALLEGPEGAAGPVDVLCVARGA
jgi:hypothetical protein